MEIVSVIVNSKARKSVVGRVGWNRCPPMSEITCIGTLVFETNSIVFYGYYNALYTSRVTTYVTM